MPSAQQGLVDRVGASQGDDACLLPTPSSRVWSWILPQIRAKLLAGEGRGEKKETRFEGNGRGEDETPTETWRELEILRGTHAGRKTPRTVSEPKEDREERWKIH